MTWTRHGRLNPGLSEACGAALALALCLAAGAIEAAGPDWRSLAAGLDLRTVDASRPGPVGDSRITILRIDPVHWELVVVGTGVTGEPSNRSARAWAAAHGLTAAINAGMFGADHRTHVGYLRHDGQVNNSRVNGYQSVAAFGPQDGEDRPPFRIFDLDDPGVCMSAILADYASVIQNLRLIKRPGQNRWAKQNKMWSEAALGEDATGRALFIFTRTPFTMADLNHELLAADIGLVAAQHLEGGPEAQLFVQADESELELFGSYETAFLENDDNAKPWPIPLVLGIRPRAGGAAAEALSR